MGGALCRGRRIRARAAVSIGHEGRTDAEAAPRAILADPLRIIARKIEIGVGPPIAVGAVRCDQRHLRSEEHTSELQSLMRISYAVFCLKKKKNTQTANLHTTTTTK